SIAPMDNDTRSQESEEGDAVERFGVKPVSGNYFSALGATAALGRTITPVDDRSPGAQPLVVLSHAFWERRFGSDPGVIGKTLSLKSRPYTVIGVASQDFIGTEKRAPDVWAQLSAYPQLWTGKAPLDERNTLLLRVMGRLKLGVSRQQAEA